MRRTLAAVALLALAACPGGSGSPPPGSLYVRWEGTLTRGEGEDAAEVPFVAEHLLVLPDRLASRTRIGGLLRRSALTGEGGWLRMGAAVSDLAGGQLAEARAWREDLESLLAAGPGDTWPTPAPRAGFEGAFSGRRSFGGLVLPRAFLLRAIFEEEAHEEETPVRREVLALRLAEAIADPGPVEGLSFSRPGDAGPGVLGEIVRSRTRATDVVVVDHEGPLTDLAKVDLFLEDALRRSRCQRKGPNARIFTSFPGEDGVAAVRTLVPVDLSHEPEAEDLPRGADVERLRGGEVLEAEYRGPYPRDDSLYEPLRRRAAELGLVVSGPPRHLILSDPDEGEPGDLRQRIRIPVREGR